MFSELLQPQQLLSLLYVRKIHDSVHFTHLDPTTREESADHRRLGVDQRSYGFSVPGVFGSEHRCLVHLCGETQRVLEQLQPQVSADVLYYSVCVCV